MNRDSEYYYGLPQEIWDRLVLETEDLLSEEQIGNHIVGLYPAGPRIYGIESASPGLLCLYIDAAEAILDPFIPIHDTVSKHIKGWNCKSYKIGENLNEIYFIELHDWIEHFIKLYLGLDDVMNKDLFSLIPLCSDVIYQSESINKIISLCTKIIKNFSPNLRQEYICCCHINDKTKDILLLRTLHIWEKEKIFCPNINKAWGQVFNIEPPLSMIGDDKNFIKDVLNGNRTSYPNYLHFLAYELNTRQALVSDFQELRQETISFYKGLL